MKRHTVFAVVLFEPPSPITVCVSSANFALFFVSSLCVAERACQSQLTGDGRGGEVQNKTTAKISRALPTCISFYVYTLL
jgi:hypothetical protein